MNHPIIHLIKDQLSHWENADDIMSLSHYIYIFNEVSKIDFDGTPAQQLYQKQRMEDVLMGILTMIKKDVNGRKQ